MSIKLFNLNQAAYKQTKMNVSNKKNIFEAFQTSISNIEKEAQVSKDMGKIVNDFFSSFMSRTVRSVGGICQFKSRAYFRVRGKTRKAGTRVFPRRVHRESSNTQLSNQPKYPSTAVSNTIL